MSPPPPKVTETRCHLALETQTVLLNAGAMENAGYVREYVTRRVYNSLFDVFSDKLPVGGVSWNALCVVQQKLIRSVAPSTILRPYQI